VPTQSAKVQPAAKLHVAIELQSVVPVQLEVTEPGGVTVVQPDGHPWYGPGRITEHWNVPWHWVPSVHPSTALHMCCCAHGAGVPTHRVHTPCEHWTPGSQSAFVAHEVRHAPFEQTKPLQPTAEPHRQTPPLQANPGSHWALVVHEESQKAFSQA
jgi:hypothetical protein